MCITQLNNTESVIQKRQKTSIHGSSLTLVEEKTYHKHQNKENPRKNETLE